MAEKTLTNPLHENQNDFHSNVGDEKYQDPLASHLAHSNFFNSFDSVKSYFKSIDFIEEFSTA